RLKIIPGKYRLIKAQVQLNQKGEAIKEIVDLLARFQQVCVQPDLDEWRHLSVPVAQLKSLFLIVNRKAVNARTLANELAVTPGNVTGIVTRLVEQELVVRKPDASDRRIFWLEATPKGRLLLDKLMENHTKQLAAILEFMQNSELNALVKGLKGLLTAFEKHLDTFKTIK
ncbi:MAG TPA: MarR family transcriptional regulator, partial [Dehalococcoidales bacterium]|nr:MarR family transcriptional regulator [Dehalococcoidales bacterium]